MRAKWQTFDLSPLDRIRYTISMNDKKQGIIYIIMAGFFFALMTFFVRMSGDLPTMQKAFFRNAVAAVAAVILLAKSDEGFKIKKDSWKGLFLRSFFGTTGLICNFYAVDHLAIADANILNKLSPFFAIIMSYFVLKEKANKTEWLCVVTAFIGAVFVVKPSMNVQFFNAMIGVIGGFGAGVAYTFVRKLGKQGERTCDSHVLFGIFMYSDGSVSACRSKAYECISDSHAAFCRSSRYRRTAFNHKGIHQGTCKGDIGVRLFAGYLCRSAWLCLFATDTGLSKCDRICYNNRQCNF